MEFLATISTKPSISATRAHLTKTIQAPGVVLARVMEWEIGRGRICDGLLVDADDLGAAQWVSSRLIQVTYSPADVPARPDWAPYLCIIETASRF